MKDILINLVQTNMVIVGQDDEDNNDVEYYDTKDCIICGEQCKEELDSNDSCTNIGLIKIFLFGM